MNLWRVTFDTSISLVLAADYDQLVEVLKDTDDKFQSLGHRELWYNWDMENVEKCYLEIVNLNEASLVLAVAH